MKDASWLHNKRNLSELHAITDAFYMQFWKDRITFNDNHE